MSQPQESNSSLPGTPSTPSTPVSTPPTPPMPKLTTRQTARKTIPTNSAGYYWESLEGEQRSTDGSDNSGGTDSSEAYDSTDSYPWECLVQESDEEGEVGISDEEPPGEDTYQDVVDPYDLEVSPEEEEVADSEEEEDDAVLHQEQAPAAQSCQEEAVDTSGEGAAMADEYTIEDVENGPVVAVACPQEESFVSGSMRSLLNCRNFGPRRGSRMIISIRCGRTA